MEAESEKGEDGQRVQQLLQVISEFKRREYLHLSLISSLERSLASAQLAGGPWGPLFGGPPTADVRDEEGRSQGATSRTSSPGPPLGGPTLRGLVLDPAAQLEIKTLRMRLAEAEGALERAREAQAAQQFSGQSVTGQRLITKCKTLQQENAELGRALAESSLQPATLQLGSLKQHVLFLKNELRQLRELNADLDNDNENLSQQLQAVFVNFSEVKAERDSLKAQVAELEAQLKATALSRPSRSGRNYAGRGSPSGSRAEPSRQEEPRSARLPSRGPSAEWTKRGSSTGVAREEKMSRHTRRAWDRERSQEAPPRRGAPEGPPSSSHNRPDRGERDRGERDRERGRDRERERDRTRERDREWRARESHRRPSDDSRSRRGASASGSSRQHTGTR